MSRYFFHVVNGQFIPDPTGTECDSSEQVRARAVEAAGAMIQEQGYHLWKTGSWHMFVCDENNNTLLKLAFEAVDLTGELGDTPH